MSSLGLRSGGTSRTTPQSVFIPAFHPTEQRIMDIEMRKLSEVKPYENNPRINDAAVDAVAASIKEFGFRQPIVVDEDGVIIVGHTRFKAALKLVLENVPVHVAHRLTPAQANPYRFADNQSTDMACLHC